MTHSCARPHGSHTGRRPAPVYDGSGYLPRQDFWKLGFVFGFTFLSVLLGVGYPYLRWLG